MVRQSPCSLFAIKAQKSTVRPRPYNTVNAVLEHSFYHLLTLYPCQPYTGYGGFSISIDPFFSSTILTFIQKYSMIFAVPSIRGGGEFGEDWHLAGCREKKVCLSF